MTKLNKHGNYHSFSTAIMLQAFLLFIMPKTALALETDVDRPGGDYARIVMNASICELLCNNDAKCKSWSYVKPGSGASYDATCWLKGVVVAPTRKVGVISGVKGAIATSPANR